MFFLALSLPYCCREGVGSWPPRETGSASQHTFGNDRHSHRASAAQAPRKHRASAVRSRATLPLGPLELLSAALGSFSPKVIAKSPTLCAWSDVDDSPGKPLHAPTQKPRHTPPLPRWLAVRAHAVRHTDDGTLPLDDLPSRRTSSPRRFAWLREPSRGAVLILNEQRSVQPTDGAKQRAGCRRGAAADAAGDRHDCPDDESHQCDPDGPCAGSRVRVSWGDAGRRRFGRHGEPVCIHVASGHPIKARSQRTSPLADAGVKRPVAPYAKLLRCHREGAATRRSRH